MKTLTESILRSNGAGRKTFTEQWCRENLSYLTITPWSVDDDCRISGDVYIDNVNFEGFPDWIRWGEVCSFTCNKTKCKSLRFGPQRVSRDYNVQENKLKTLEGCAQYVGGDFVCSGNELESLEGCPQEVGGAFKCSHNKLKSLEGCPREIHGYFYCNNNKLKSLEGGPKIVNGDYYCQNNELETLGDDKILINYEFWCYGNKKKFTKEEVYEIVSTKKHNSIVKL